MSKTIIAGGRNITDYNYVIEACKQSHFVITEVVSGMAKGVDTLGEQWAREHNIPIKQFPANWDKYGRRAGPIRNEEMGDYSECLIAIWDGKSRGTKHMIDYATKKGLKIYIYKIYLRNG
ncbi:MAG: DUF2493 domain-containing protein [Proteobacteria bacterium]|nr:DUF2493 domain-containing protein [Pseudomonadota bacterium]